MKKYILLFLTILIIPSVFSLTMLEPLHVENIEYEVDIGVVAPGEFFLISFLDEGFNFRDLVISEECKNLATKELTQFTPKSIFTTLRISKDVSGFNLLKLELISEKETKEVVLALDVSEDVITVVTEDYSSISEYGKEKEIALTLINKSMTTKEITITSNLQSNWFSSKDIILDQDVVKTLPPISKTTIKYSFIPKGVGDKDFKLFVYTKNIPREQHLRPIDALSSDFKRHEIDIKINIVKTLGALYSANQYYFPLYGLNALPVYFFNNIIRILEK